MSSSEDDEQRTRYEFKGRFGAIELAPHPTEEASHFEVDAFVRDILGLTKSQGTEPTEIES